jgi:hypothetical protein
MTDKEIILKQWSLLCGGISNEHKNNIISKIIENRDINRKLLDINYKINNILFELNIMKQSEKKDKALYNTKLNTIEDLIKIKGILIQNKAEIL